MKEVEVMTNIQGDIVGVLRVYEGDARLAYLHAEHNEDIGGLYDIETDNLQEWAKDVCRQNGWDLIDW